MFHLILQLHKGGGGSSSTTVNQAYQPTSEERRLWRLQGDYQEKAMPYMVDLLETSKSMLNANNYGTIGADFGTLNNDAMNQISLAQQGVRGLTNGELPQNYIDNMTQVVQNGVNKSLGQALNNNARAGVLSSSVMTQANKDIANAASETMANMYSSNIDKLNGLFGQMDSMSGDKITSTAAAQEAALSPMLSILSASQGGAASNTSAIGALKGTGTTTGTSTTQSNKSNSGLFGSIFGAANAVAPYAAAAMACFTGETDIALPKGKHKRIDEIKVGDEVMSYNEDTRKNEPATVVKVQTTENVPTYQIEAFDSEMDDYITVTTTPTQPVLLRDGFWCKADDLVVGMTVCLSMDGFHLHEATITNTGWTGDNTKVYDLKVDSKSNSYVADGFIATGMLDE